jgi:hypothetical protein
VGHLETLPIDLLYAHLDVSFMMLSTVVQTSPL